MDSKLSIKDKTKASEGIKVAPFRQHIRKTLPHKHNSYFEIIYLTKGSGFHTIDTVEYEIKTPVVFTIRKEQVHFWDIHSLPEGYVVIIKKSFVENCLDAEIKRLISELSAQTCLFPSSTLIDEIFKLLCDEVKGKSLANRAIIEGLLKALLAKLLESSTPNSSPQGKNTIFRKFVALLENDQEVANKVSFYAGKLNTTPQNLNAICRKEIGESASTVLSEHLINEAKRRLIYTNDTVSEIGNKLGFKDNSHFTKYFKRYVDLTPSQFRKTNN
ncbi:helix-turn-helix domain-containing protein [Brumimicrobium aurantiacum]|uniref:Helix-turn-helix domain-containing protein n=2 Tax=Brumimicrobium aurantiacum TaxID=1737063 RepID=A0A3E1F146_9FLAO|nr:helix-turn-helix domain-containing protein [Brumimicrobium aurantiacum]